MEAYLNEKYLGDRFIGVVGFYLQHKKLIQASKGSSGNHQAYPGGYVEHMTQCFVIANKLYSQLSEVGKLNFTLQSACIVLFFHDIEKIWKYTVGLDKDFDKATWYFDTLKDEYEITFSFEEANALKYVHGEGADYSNEERVMKPLAAFCHMVDVASARIFFDQIIPEYV